MIGLLAVMGLIGLVGMMSSDRANLQHQLERQQDEVVQLSEAVKRSERRVQELTDAVSRRDVQMSALQELVFQAQEEAQAAREAVEAAARQRDEAAAAAQDAQAAYERAREETHARQEELREAQAELDALRQPTRWRHMASDELRARATAALRDAGLELDPERFNAVVVGTTGSGKSTLICGLMMLWAVQSGLPVPPRSQLPPTSAVSEGTLRMQAWKVPRSPITLFDCPGGNTLTADTRSYVEQQHLAVFQMQIVVVERRFEELHANLLWAHKEKYPGQRLVVVFAKGNALLADILRASPSTDRDQAIVRIKSETAEAASRLVPGGYHLPPDRIFVVNAHALQDAATAGDGGGGGGRLLELEERRLLGMLATAVVADSRAD